MPIGGDVVMRLRPVHALVAALLGCAVTPLASAPSLAEADATCAAEVVAESDARAMAMRCGQSVEVLSARTPWETVTAGPDGQLTWQSGVLAQRTDVDGTWRDVDTTVVATAEGVTPVAPVLPMTFSAGGADAPLARIEHQGRAVEVFWPLGALPQPTVSGAKVTYPSVLPDVDLVLTVDEDATGFSEVLVVHNPEAAANPALAQPRSVRAF